ncbi:MAG: UvrD-helicase domain-containing protein, partial [Pirellulales bacterium]|nr:UvrD-helicase domain-containing protein [Pirellulales bacterium]
NQQLTLHLQDILQALDALPGSADAQEAVAALRELARTQGVCKEKDWGKEADYVDYRDTCKAVRELVDGSLLRLPLADGLLHETATVGLELLHLLTDLSECYEQVKRERNVLEFDDLLAKTYRLLTNKRFSAVRKSLHENMRLLMVDEFQDTDPLQVAIVQALCGAKSLEQGLFVVGDSKQSIYRFRGAQPQVSDRLRASLPAESRLSLTTNFRSQPAILDFVNALFYEAFEQEYEPLSASRPQRTPTPAVEFLWATGAEQTDNDALARQVGPSQLSRMHEARFLARRLSQLLDSEEQIVVDADSGLPRSLQPGDIAILLRSLSDVNLYEEALREYGLDYYLVGGHAFYAQQEIYDVLHLLRAIASPADELSLAGALRSPLFSLEDEVLFWLVESHRSLNEGLFSSEIAAPLTEQQCAKVRRAADTINHLRQWKDQLLVAELFGKAIAMTGYDATLLCDFLGRRKLANVQKLLDQARSFDRTSPGDLDGFITQLSEFVVRAPQEPLAAARAEGDVIRIMTIHYAKGLEFPLVVVPDLNRKTPPSRRSPVLDEQLGPLVPPEKETEKEEYCVGWNMFQFVEQQQDLEERKRLLYVACTRAADYLILSSSVKDLESALKSPGSDWLKFLGSRFDLLSGHCLADLPDGYGAPQLLVTSEEPQTERKPTGKSRGADLTQLVEKTRALAQAGKGTVPESVEAIPVDSRARKRFSFSRLSGQLKREDRLTGRDLEFPTESSSFDSREVGTLVHAVLKRIDFRAPGDVPGLCEFLAPLHLETHWAEAAAAASEMVQGFLESKRADEMAAARLLRREVEFVMPWTRQQSPYEGHYLHGYIDCLYQDAAGHWHLVDYKSNQVTAAGVPVAAEHYAMQMFVYSLACQRALGCAPVESVLCFLKAGAEFRFDWDAQARTELTSQLQLAIDSLLVPVEPELQPS